MKIVIPGGSGQIGSILGAALLADGHEVVTLSRGVTEQPWRSARWDGATLGEWVREVDGSDVVINLAGRSVDCATRLPIARRSRSRIDSTRVIGAATPRALDRRACGCRPPPPRSTRIALTRQTTSDRHRGRLEPDAPSAWRFSIEVAQAWEQAARECITPSTRQVIMRSAMTMGPGRGGVFDTLLTLARWGLGGVAGDGRQFVSWIHAADFVRAINWLIAHDDIDGIINLASPNPLPYREFMAALRRAAHVRIGLPSPAWLLEIGTFFLRTESELVLKSRRVVPGRLLAHGFEFTFPTWPDAAVDLVRCAQIRR
jgi:hypothetical protein